MDAIRYGEQLEVRAAGGPAVHHARDRDKLQDPLEEQQLAHDAMDASAWAASARRWSGPKRDTCSGTTWEAFFRELFWRPAAARHREARPLSADTRAGAGAVR